MAGTRIFLLDYGWLLGSEIDMFLPGKVAANLGDKYPGGKLDIAVSGVVLEHKDGRVLFDCGFSLEAAKSFHGKFSEENLIENQLRLVGLKPSDISYVILSHLHFDHVGQAAIFREYKVPIIVSKKELEFALLMAWQGKDPAYRTEDLLPLKNAAWFPIDRRDFELLDGIKIIWTGAHTPGHIVMEAESGSGKRYVFTGDFIHIPDQYQLENGGWLTGDREEFFSYIREMKLTAMTRKANVVIGHDPQLWEKYPKAPKSLD